MSPLRIQSEKAFQQQIVQLAGFYGWTTYHTYDSRRSAPGFPDLVMFRKHELIFAELKTERGRVSNDQARWIAGLSAVSMAVHRFIPGNEPIGVDVYLWRPSDFDDIHARLARGRQRVPALYGEAA